MLVHVEAAQLHHPAFVFRTRDCTHNAVLAQIILIPMTVFAVRSRNIEQGAMSAYLAVKFLHILTVVFMAAPLYNLILVHERQRFGKAPFAVDRYFENVV